MKLLFEDRKAFWSIENSINAEHFLVKSLLLQRAFQYVALTCHHLDHLVSAVSCKRNGVGQRELTTIQLGSFLLLLEYSKSPPTHTHTLYMEWGQRASSVQR